MGDKVYEAAKKVLDKHCDCLDEKECPVGQSPCWRCKKNVAIAEEISKEVGVGGIFHRIDPFIDALTDYADPLTAKTIRKKYDAIKLEEQVK